MNTQKNIQAEIEKTLNSLNSYTKRKAKPFLYTRIQEKLGKETAANTYNWLFDTPILKPVFASLIILINVFTVWQLAVNKENQISETENYIESFNEEYAFNESSVNYFDIYTDNTTLDE